MHNYLSILIDRNTTNIFRVRLNVIGKRIIDERQNSFHIFLKQIQTSVRSSVERVADLSLAFQLIESVDVVDNRMRNVVHVNTRWICIDADGMKSVKMRMCKMLKSDGN